MADVTTKFTVRTYDTATRVTATEVMDAESVDELRRALDARGLTMLDAKAVGKGLNRDIGRPRRVKQQELAAFARMFATMVGADMSVLNALHILAEEQENRTLSAAIADTANQIEGGTSLAAALGNHPEVFPPLVISLVGAGEAGGFLDKALVSAAEALESNVKLRGDIKAAATYPVVVLCIGLVASMGILLFVMPIFASMFTDLGGKLPMLTRMTLGLSVALRWGIVPLTVAVTVFVLWWRTHKNDEKVRAVVDPVKLRLPVFGPLIRWIAVTRLCRNLATMFEAGVPVLTAVRESAPTADNQVVRDAVLAAGEHARQGSPLSDHLGDGGVIPKLVVSMVAAGEQSGAVDTMLKKVAQFYDQQVETRTKQLSSMLEPILIVIIGIMIGSLVVAMYLPMFSIFSLIG